MVLRDCILCGATRSGFSMVRMPNISPTAFRCKDDECLLPKIKEAASKLTPQQISGLVGALDAANKPERFPWQHGVHAAMPVGGDPRNISVEDELRPIQPTASPLQEEFGFQQPEDGSEERYKQRQLDMPWAKHQFWWFIHNNVAHPLIGVLPIRVFFRFHDYTSRRMHGVPRSR